MFVSPPGYNTCGLHIIHMCNYYYFSKCYVITNRIGGVIVSVLATSAVDRGLESRSGQTKDYEISICCFPAKH